MKNTAFRRTIASVTMALATVACHRESSAAGGGAKPPVPSSSASADPTGGTIRVGLIAPLTGSYSALGNEDKKAVELAVEQTNTKGGLLGHQIELVNTGPFDE
jgi:ABC-type branched-subunit amino acid transport system substrate-binding protein